MKALIWTTAAALIIGVLFVLDAVRNWPSGSIFETDREVYENVILSSTIGATLIGIGILAGLLTLHARAIGQQTRRALEEQDEANMRRAEHALRQEQALRMRHDHRS